MARSDYRTARKPLPGGEALKRWRKKNQLTRTEMAARFGIDRIQIIRLETGERQRVSVEVAAAIELATGGEVSWRLWLPAGRAA